MNYQQFVSAIEVRIKQCMKGNMSICIHTAIKNNGMERKGITVSERGINISPTIYLEEYYEQFQNGKSMEQIVDKILELYQEVRFEHSWEVDCVQDYDKIKKKIVYKIINLEANRKLLEEMPYISYLDLAIVFYVLIELGNHGTATMLIQKDHMEKWGITKKKLYQDATHNTKKLLPEKFQTMISVIQEILTTEELKEETGELQEDMLYILSNQMRNFGAACILYEGVLEEIGRQLGENYYVLPSSVHEVIIMPDKQNPCRKDLDDMITEINETQVEAEDILSNHAYYYNRKEKSFQ
ncbi:MAG: DUF5688 family protein [Lachnospiraceae bacterium]